MKKLVPLAIAICLCLVIGAVLIIDHHQALTPQSSHGTGHVSKVHKINAVPLPAVTTTTVAPVMEMPTTLPTSRPVSTIQIGGESAVVAPTTVLTTVPTPTPLVAAPIQTNVTINTIISGCGSECTLLTAVVTGGGDTLSPPAATLSFYVWSRSSNVVVGLFTTKTDGQTNCQIEWSVQGDIANAHSPDCTGFVGSTSTVSGLFYTATFTQSGYSTSTS